MANVKITDLPSLTGANSASTDVLAVVDVSADITSKMTRAEFFSNIPAITVAGTATITGLFSSANVAITGGSISGITDLAIVDGGTGASTAANARTNLGLGTIATQSAASVTITGGSITGITDLAVADGGTGASTLTGYVKGSGTSALTASATIPNTDISGLGTMSTQAASSVAITGGTINATPVGATTPSTGAFTTLSASSTVSGTGFSTYLASPPAIGGTVASAGKFTGLVTTGDVYFNQPAPTSKSAAATLTIAELLTDIIRYTGAVATLTLPTGTLIEGGVVSGLAVDGAFDFFIINTGTGIVTLDTSTGITTIGTMTVAIAASACFRVRKTAVNTYTVYRIS